MAKKESKRQRQVAELVRRNMSVVLQQEGRYIYGNEILVTVTNVKMSPDLSLASIYLSVFNTDNKQVPLIELQENAVNLRQSLAARIRRHIRRIPDIQFFLDETLDEIERIDDLFDRLKED